MSALPNHDRLLDLLTARAVDGLSDAEQQELQTLLTQYPELTGDELEATLAALTLAAPFNEVMPAHLVEQILANAPVASANPPATVLPFRRTPVWQSAGTAWLSAAACLLLAVAGWWPRLTGELAPVTHTAMLTPEQQRAALLQTGRAIQASWSPGADAAGNALVGDVVFDPISQKGYLRFRGIPANDPRLEQYQLWIADAARKPPEPVDGGVFNTPQNTVSGDVIIPFEAKLPVGKPAAFVVTVEQPGGVVVSKQERVLALAKVL